MYIVFLLMWIIFNGNLTWEIFILGLVVAAAVYAFLCAFLGYSVKKDLVLLKKSPQILQYVFVLVWEIIKANAVAARRILSPKVQNDPVIVRFKTDLRTGMARAVLANSITLTPGTITVSLNEDELTVHCLDKSMAEGMEDSVFVKLLRKLEA